MTTSFTLKFSFDVYLQSMQQTGYQNILVYNPIIFVYITDFYIIVLNIKEIDKDNPTLVIPLSNQLKVEPFN